MVDILPVVRKNVACESAMMTDEAGWYKHLGKDFASHATVNHSQEEYVRGIGVIAESW
jgi:hypothetical protein